MRSIPDDKDKAPAPSKVYFMDDHASHCGESTPFKAVKLLRDAGIKELFKKGDTVGIKIHTGEYGNSLNLRPHWIKAVVDEIQRLGGYPVIVETNTCINSTGAGRTDTETHRRTASRHGINEQTMGCPVWLPDGAMDIRGEKCDVPNGVYLNHTYVSGQMLRLDAVIVVSHFKGHPQGVFGGAIKNVGIGMASTLGKATAHFINHPKFGVKAAPVNIPESQHMMDFPHPNVVDGMIKGCPFNAYEIADGMLVKHPERCTGCSACFNASLYGGMLRYGPEPIKAIAATIADSAAGIINRIGKEKFLFLNYAFDITPSCDCSNHHDRPIVSNIGTFVSHDPVAVDMACLEAAESLCAIPGSKADDFGLSEPDTERFTNCASMAQVSQWIQINSAVHNGIGGSEYILVESEPLSEAEVISWHYNYSAANPVGFVFRDLIRRADFSTDGIPARDEPSVPRCELDIKPTGKVGETFIGD